jgi:CTP synthase (UTP-ammonia lyase)
MKEADHEESSPDAAIKLISKLSCSLVGQSKVVRIIPGSLAGQIYGAAEANELFACNYGLNETFSDQIATHGLRVSGFDEEGTVRMVELPDHPFYIATLFVPQSSSSAEAPHPLIVAFLRAALIKKSGLAESR